ncbi:MAG: hypothetical protein NTX51_13660 [Verrucomicrobia bacterium]|nr:hypothetical protein [Verrucomicrobiota bacterium]
MKTHNQLYGEICSFENLLRAARRAESGKRLRLAPRPFVTEWCIMPCARW